MKVQVEYNVDGCFNCPYQGKFKDMGTTVYLCDEHYRNTNEWMPTNNKKYIPDNCPLKANRM